MADVTYAARRNGCEVRLAVESGLVLTVGRSGLVDPNPVVTGSEELLNNLALVTRLSGYASNELAFRRLRSPEKRASHRRAAERDQQDAVAIGRMVLRLGDESASRWCSGRAVVPGAAPATSPWSDALSTPTC